MDLRLLKKVILADKPAKKQLIQSWSLTKGMHKACHRLDVAEPAAEPAALEYNNHTAASECPSMRQ